jgi:hypothetical protein
MSNFAWTQEIEELSPAALTVRAQTISPNDDGMLKWDMFFPRQNVDSVDLDDVTTIDYRAAADRREWNQRGRLIPIKTPDRRKVSIVPIESYYTWGEYEMQKLRERTMGNDAVLQQIMQSTVPGRVDALTRANYRRLELDTFQAWALGTITQKNPQTGETYSASFGFDSSRYQTAGTAWNNGAVDAYDLLVGWLEDAINAVGAIEGVVLPLNVLKEIQNDAPTLVGGVAMTRAQLAQRVSDDIGSNFTFYPMEDTIDVFDDGGTATTRTKVWARQRVAVVPAGARVGYTAFAPVTRAMDIARQVPAARVDVNGMTVFYEEMNNGRELTLEVQGNQMPVPDEQKLFVINVGF